MAVNPLSALAAGGFKNSSAARGQNDIGQSTGFSSAFNVGGGGGPVNEGVRAAMPLIAMLIAGWLAVTLIRRK